MESEPAAPSAPQAGACPVCVTDRLLVLRRCGVSQCSDGHGRVGGKKQAEREEEGERQREGLEHLDGLYWYWKRVTQRGQHISRRILRRDFDGVVLDDGVRQELLAHRLHANLGL